MDAIVNLTDIDRRFGIPDIARVCEGKGGLSRVDITSPLAHGARDLMAARWQRRSAVSQLEIAMGRRPGHSRRNPDLLSLVSRQGGQSSRSGAWICANKTLAALFNHRE